MPLLLPNRLLLIAILLVSPTLPAQPPPTTFTPPGEDGTTGTDHPGSDGRHYWVRSGGACVGGAILGSVIPGLGNVVGCALGALGGWLVTWMQEPEDEYLHEGR